MQMLKALCKREFENKLNGLISTTIEFCCDTNL